MKHMTLTNPYAAPTPIVQIGAIAQSILGGLDSIEPGDARNRALLERALAVAAAAEQRLAAQNDRIAFLESLSRTDELTGLMNRRGFVEELRKALARARRSGESGVLIFCDIDSFKSVNDRYGHAAGDQVLCVIGQTITASVREVDTVARLGGDEFVILLSEVSRRDAQKRARMLQHQLDRCEYRFGANRIHIGVSLGIEPYGSNDEVNDLLSRADMDMYCNKRRKASAALRIAAAAE